MVKKLKPKLLHVLHQFKQPKFNAKLLWDYWMFQRNYAHFLSDGGERADPNRKVLVVSLTNWIAQVKMEGMLAKALQLRGFTPLVLTRRSCKSVLKYFECFGIRDFAFYEDFLSKDPDIQREFAHLLEEFLEASSFKHLLALEYKGVDVGRHILSTLFRHLRHEVIDLKRPDVKFRLERILQHSLQSLAVARSVLESLNPEILLFLEKGYTPYGEIFDIAINHEINTIQWLHSQRSDALIFKRYNRANRDMHPFSLDDDTWDWVRSEMPWNSDMEEELLRALRESYEKGSWFKRKYLHDKKVIKTRDAIFQQLDLDPEKKTAVVFSHVLWDATFFYGDNLFENYEHWLAETVKAACKNDSLNWIIKIHPDYVWKAKKEGIVGEPRDLLVIRQSVRSLPAHVKLLRPETDINTFSLFDIADYCITVRGTIGIEMACFGIPVLTAGSGRYSGRGFTLDSETSEGYLEKLLHIQTIPRMSKQETLLARKHAYCLFLLRPFPFETFEMYQATYDGLGTALDHNVCIRLASFDDLEKACDLRDFATWAEDASRTDFLRPTILSNLSETGSSLSISIRSGIGKVEA